MPFPLKIRPVDIGSPTEPGFLKSVVKSRLKRLFERPFGNVLRITGAEKVVTDGGNDQIRLIKDDPEEFEPSSICLSNMVRNFIEEGGDKQVKCSRSKCYCFNNSVSDGSDDEIDSRHVHACQILKGLVLCSNVTEINLLADTAKIVEENESLECKNDYSRKLVTDGLIALGYDASICKSRWERAPRYPAGVYDYIDVIKGDERLIIDIDFRSVFEIARSTKNYNAILQILPQIFVGKADRLQKITYLVSDAAKQSLKKKGMSFPPWRRADYVESKWLSAYTRLQSTTPTPTPPQQQSCSVIAGVKSPASSDHIDALFSMSEEEEAK